MFKVISVINRSDVVFSFFAKIKNHHVSNPDFNGIKTNQRKLILLFNVNN